ncbi:MAG: nucleotidyltransferase domain-containing protein [Cyanobacteria bacterium J06621_11]
MEISKAQLYERLGVSEQKLRDFCVRSPITELAFFGSVIRNDFRADSDIDVLVILKPNHGMGLIEYFKFEEQFKEMFNREVDLVDKEVIEKERNWIRRREILNNAQVIYESGRILSA